jgi:cytidyltransferase-like protein
MFEYIFTIGCFDKLHKGHIKLLENMQKHTEKIIVGLHDNNSIEKLKNISDIDSYDNRKKSLEKYAHDVFEIDSVDPTKAIQNYILNNFNQDLLSIEIGSSKTNSKIIKNNYIGELFLIHKYKDTFKYYCKDNNIIVTRTDNNHGWGQNLIGYKMNWCFMRADDNKNFPAIDYIKSIMPIKYLPYSNEISATKLRDFKKNKLGLMNYLLGKVVDIMDENNIPYYLDCGTLLGCIRENGLMEKDTDIDVTIHLSSWDKLKSIDFIKYGLKRTRTLDGFPNNEDGNMISIKTKYSNFYCDIYTNPAFPQLDKKNLNGKNYNIPLNSELYLTQLYNNWKIPSRKHASTKFHRGNGLVNSEYSNYWDKDFKIFKCNM